MSTTKPDPNAALHIPNRVAIQLPSGDVQAGDVVDTEYVASAPEGIERMFTVDVDGSTFKRLASEVGAP